MCDYGISFVNKHKIEGLRNFTQKYLTSKDLVKGLYESSSAIPEGYYLGEVEGSVFTFLKKLVPVTTALDEDGDDEILIFSVRDFLKAVNVGEYSLLFELKYLYDAKESAIEATWEELQEQLMSQFLKGKSVEVLELVISQGIIPRKKFIESDIVFLEKDQSIELEHLPHWKELVYIIFYSRLNFSNIDEDDYDSLFYIKED